MGDWRRKVSALLILILIAGVYSFPFGASGATYTFTQTSWSGGATGNTATHTSNQSGWTEYSSKDSAVSAVNGGADVSLSSTNYTFTDDGTTTAQNGASGGGFGNGTNSSTVVSGSGAAGSVGIITEIGGLTALATPTIATGSGPEEITISPDGTSAYVANYNSNTVSMYSRNTSTGALTALATPTIVVGTYPNNLTISPDGLWVYVITTQVLYNDEYQEYYDYTTLSKYSRNASTGALTYSSYNEISVLYSRNKIAISPDGTSVYIVNYSYSSGLLYAYSRNTTTGAISNLTIDSESTGNSPSSVTISPDGTSVYVANYNSNTVGMYSRATSTGVLGYGGAIPTGTGPNGVIVSPDGTSVYVTNTTSNTVSMYSRNTSTGALTALATPTIAAGTSPNDITISPDGTSVYVANGSSATASIYSRNTSTGALTALATPTIAAGTNPRAITISPNGASVYVANYGSNTVSMYSRASGYTSGTFTSGVINTGAMSTFTTFAYATTLNAQTITMDARAGNTATPDGSWTAWQTGIASGGSISGLAGNQYIQYRANLSTTNSAVTPTLDSVTVNYNQYASSGDLTSSVYNSSSTANLLSKLTWSATDTSSTETVQFQVRSASTSGGLSSASWCGYEDCSGTTYFDAAESGVTLSLSHPLLAGSDDQYFQYRVILSSAGAATPTLSNIIVQYVVNAAPDFDTSFGTNGITVSQISDSLDSDWGKIRIQYKVRDTDATEGTNTPSLVTPSFSYNIGAGFVTITALRLSANALTNKAVDEVSYSQYEVIWDAKTDISDTYTAALQVRVTVNDNEAANNTAAATDTIAFDSKSPALGAYPLLVDASLIPATVTLSATDDSTLSMRVGLAADLTGASWEAYNASKSLTLVTNPDTVYAQYRDTYGNETTISSVISTDTPSLMIVQDVSNAIAVEWRLFVSWRAISEPPNGFANYKLYRSSDNVTFSLITTVSSRILNYYIDDTTAFDTLYYYKIKATDGVGNASWFSAALQGKANGTQDASEGGGGSETTPPTISGVASGALSTTQATITWSTDELADSTVGFSTVSGVFVDEIGIANFADNVSGTGVHEVVLTGLVPDTTYYYQVKSTDPSGNEAIDDNGGSGYTFTTTPGPAISGVALSGAANTQATITWNTDTNASTFVSYSTVVSGGALVSPVELGTTTLVLDHSQTLTGLTTGTRYYFFVKSIDTDSNVATDNNGGAFYEFTTTSDVADPNILSVDTPVLTHEKAVITWTTDEQADSQVRYALTSGGPYTATTATVTYGEAHYVILSSLVSDTTYYYRVVSSDLSGNQTIFAEGSFMTIKDPAYQHDPLSDITSMSAVLVTDTHAVISLVTDQAALCMIEYGTAPGSNAATPISETLENKRHTITIPSLLFGTTYYYQATCEDNLGNIVVSGEENFTTLIEQVDAGSETGDTSAPEITSVGVSALTGEDATITWDTNEDTNGYVRYGITTDFGNMAGDDLVNTDIGTYTTAHTVVLKNLVPSTKYYYMTLSSDASGNLSMSSESSFTTKSPSSISSINILSDKIGEATVTWKTSSAMSSIVEYGLVADTYSDKQESGTVTKEHSLTVTKLQSNQIYHFRVKGKDANDNLYSSSDYTFEPKSLPQISNVVSRVISDNEVRVDFTTSVPTDALVVFTNTKDSKDTGSQGKPDLSTAHSLLLKNLQSGATYSGRVVARDEAGNEVAGVLGDFTTSQDITAPTIDQMKTDMALSQDGKVQAIVSWYTDEPTATAITYKEGSTGEEKTVSVKSDYTTAHIAVITSFKIGSVYFLKAHSTDQSGNETVSKERMILTPQISENVVQMIIGNFKDIFSWAKL